jgi:hypothetical protein
MPSHRKTHRKPANAEQAAKPPDRWRPWLLAGVIALLAARLLFPSESAAAQGDGLTLVMLWLALGVIWLLGGIGRKSTSLRFGPVDATVLVLAAWNCFAAAYAVRYGSPRPALNMLWEWVGVGMMFFLLRQLIHDAGTARAVLAAMVAVMAAISVYGIYQRAIELPALKQQFDADPDAMLHENGYDYPPGDSLREQIVNRMKNPQPFGTFALTNSLAAALAPWLVASLWIAAAAWQRRRQAVAWLICIAPIALCLLLTKSRSGYIAAAVGILWLGFKRLPAAWTRAIVLTALLGVAAMFSFSNAAKSLSFRVQYWQATLRMIADRPLMGCGPGNFQDVYTQYKLPDASEEVSDPHDFLLEIWATAGTPAILALMTVLVLFARHGAANGLWRGAGTSEFVARDGELGAPAQRVGAGPPIHGSGGPALAKAPWSHPTAAPGSPPNDWKFVLAGLVGGFLLSIPLGQMSSATPNIAAAIIGLPVGVACFLLLLPWVREGFFPPVVAGVAVVVLLVDLLTTGGIGIPAVAQSLWVFIALGLSQVSPLPYTGEGGHHVPMVGVRVPHSLPRSGMILLLAIGLGLMIACHQTAFARVLPCLRFQKLARHESLIGRRQSALDLMQQAVDADPLSWEARDFLAELCLQAWLANQEASQEPADYHEFEVQDAWARRLAPQSAPIWRASADRFQRAYTKTDSQGRHAEPRAIEEAIEIGRRTVELYPNSASDHAALAAIYQIFGDEASYRREAETALELDRNMPHKEKKLPEATRRKLEAP